MKFSLLLKITIWCFDLKKMAILGNNEVSTFTLVHHSFLIKCWGIEIDRNQRHSFAGRHFELLETKVNERHLVRICIGISRTGCTSPLYAASFTSCGQESRFRLRKPRVRLALVQILLTCIPSQIICDSDPKILDAFDIFEDRSL